MRLRHGLLNEDLAEGFGVSTTFCSNIFIWIKLLSKVLGKALVVWPAKESIREHLPEIFLKSGYGKFCVIIVSTVINLNFWLELHPLGLFCSSLLVVGVEQATRLSPEIVSFMIYWKGMMK